MAYEANEPRYATACYRFRYDNSQTMTELECQHRRIKEYCLEHNIEIIGEYIDMIDELGIELVCAAKGANYSSAWLSHLANMFEMVGESPEK